MLIGLVLWSFMIVLLPLSLGLGYLLIAAIARRPAATLRGPSAWLSEGDSFPPHV